MSYRYRPVLLGADIASHPTASKFPSRPHAGDKDPVTADSFVSFAEMVFMELYLVPLDVYCHGRCAAAHTK